jgi:hypothetical protein
MTRVRAGWFTALALASTAAARADSPQLANITPFGVQRGTPTVVTVAGANLAGNPQLVAPFPLTAEPEPNQDPKGGAWKIKVTVPPSLAVGVYVLRVRTDDGISNPLLFAVGQLPQVSETEDNSSFETAQSVPSPVIVEGQSAGTDVDFFKFPGKKGQRIVVDAQCARIGSGVDPQIRLTTAGRTYIASADDSPGLVTDARLTAVLPEDGDYVVELSDTRYQGGGRPIYRLVIGPVPSADEVYPLGGRRGETVGFELRGGTLPELKVGAATLETGPGVDSCRPRMSSVSLGLTPPAEPSLDVELPGSIDVSDYPELREAADAQAPPVRGTAPVVFNGRIDPAGDEDRFVVSVVPGQSLRVQVNAADLGSALDGSLQALGAKDAVIATADDTTIAPIAPKGQQKNAPGIVSPDPSLVFTVPAGLNEITLALRDLEGRGGTGFPYRITVEPSTPTFELALADAQISVRKGGTAAIAVTASRQGYGGPIELSIADPPPGVTVRAGRVAEGQTLGALSISAAADTTFGPSVLKVLGTGQGPGGPIVVAASKLLVFAQQGPIATSFQNQVGLAAASAGAGPIGLDVPAEAIEVVHGIGGSIAVKVARTAGADAALAVTPLPLPPGITFAPQNIAEKATEAALNLVVAPEAPLGDMSIALSAKGKFGDKEQTFSTPAIALKIVRPAAVELAGQSVEIHAGATAELKGKLLRKGAFKEPVTCKLDGLPAGVKSDPLTVAPDASEFTIKLTADGGAPAAMAQAKFVLAFQINKKDYATPPTALALKVVK